MKVKCAIFAFFAVLQCFVNGDEAHKENFKQASLKCIKDMGLDEAKIKEFYHGKTGETNDQQIKCYLKCTMQALNWMDEAGNIIDHTEEDMPKALHDFAKECAASVSATEPCEKAYLFHVCFLEKKHAAGHDHHNPH